MSRGTGTRSGPRRLGLRARPQGYEPAVRRKTFGVLCFLLLTLIVLQMHCPVWSGTVVSCLFAVLPLPRQHAIMAQSLGPTHLAMKRIHGDGGLSVECGRADPGGGADLLNMIKEPVVPWCAGTCEMGLYRGPGELVLSPHRGPSKLAWRNGIWLFSVSESMW